jgi:uncharacterized protein YjiS (DUF1127 family)
MRDAAYEIARQQDGFGESHLGGLYRQIVGGVMRWVNQRAALAYLTRLDDHLLKDVGLSRADLDRAGPSAIAAAEAQAQFGRWSR